MWRVDGQGIRHNNSYTSYIINRMTFTTPTGRKSDAVSCFAWGIPYLDTLGARSLKTLHFDHTKKKLLFPVAKAEEGRVGRSVQNFFGHG